MGSRVGKKEKIFRLAIIFLLVAVAFVYIFPLLVIFTNSFMDNVVRNFGDTYDFFDHELIGEISYVRYMLIPERISLQQYYTLLFQTPMYLNHFANSVRLTGSIVIMHVVVGVLAGYGFTIWQWKYKEFVFIAYIIVMVLPFQATLVPNFVMVNMLGMLNTHRGIILPLGFSPFAVFVMRQSMRGIPPSIFEAAQIDGANGWRCLVNIAIPISKSGIAALVILSFADGWAMVEHPMIFLRYNALEPLSVVLYRMGQDEIGLIFAASVFYMLPMVWLFLYGQEYFEQGVKLSALR